LFSGVHHVEESMSHKKIALLLTALTVILLACQILTSLTGPGGDKNQTATAGADQVLATNAKATLDVLATNDAAKVTATTAPTETPAVDTQATQAALTQAASEAAAGAELTSTAAVFAQATAEAQEMFSLVQKLQSQGYLANTDGEYTPLADFDESWAQINWYQWKTTGYSPDSFVLRANFWWDSASDKANWFSSGCGFVFGEEDKDNHDLAYLGLDGNVYVSRIRNGNWKTLAQRYYGKVEIPQGQADIVMVVASKKIIFFVNDKKVVEVTDSAYKPGELNLTLLSGTNAGFGTHCKISNIGLWILQ
jgi:uncharacterized surface protein with fasciclin (FAS1) repeats